MSYKLTWAHERFTVNLILGARSRGFEGTNEAIWCLSNNAWGGMWAVGVGQPQVARMVKRQIIEHTTNFFALILLKCKTAVD